MKLHHLNDDCLLEIFSRLPNADLCAIKDTCHRFRGLANGIAKVRFKRELYFDLDRNHAQVLAQTIQHFGKFMRDADIVVTTKRKLSPKQVFTVLKRCESYELIEIACDKIDENLIDFTENCIQIVQYFIHFMNHLEFITFIEEDCQFLHVIKALKRAHLPVIFKYSEDSLVWTSKCNFHPFDAAQ